MTKEREDGARPSGLAGSLRMLAALAVMLLGGVAILLVLDVIPREVFGEIVSKAVASVAILAVVAGAVAFLVRSR
ncbi:MAG: hypothetical protein U1F52_13085 [Burkholderiales bacterium]